MPFSENGPPQKPPLESAEAEMSIATQPEQQDTGGETEQLIANMASEVLKVDVDERAPVAVEQAKAILAALQQGKAEVSQIDEARRVINEVFDDIPAGFQLEGGAAQEIADTRNTLLEMKADIQAEKGIKESKEYRAEGRENGGVEINEGSAEQGGDGFVETGTSPEAKIKEIHQKSQALTKKLNTFTELIYRKEARLLEEQYRELGYPGTPTEVATEKQQSHKRTIDGVKQEIKNTLGQWKEEMGNISLSQEQKRQVEELFTSLEAKVSGQEQNPPTEVTASNQDEENLTQNLAA